jgi:putative copper resistance protein D
LGFIVAAGILVSVSSPRRPWIAIGAGVLLASMAFIGHAAMVEGAPGNLRRFNQMIHLLATGAWLGGLIPLGLVLAVMRSQPGMIISTVYRFSGFGTAAVALILLTGVINTAALVPSAEGLITSSYGLALLAKVALVSAMIGIAFFNRFNLTPQVTTRGGASASLLKRSIILETGVGLVTVLIASLLGTLAPPVV